MKRILFFTIGMFLSVTAQSAVIYQSGGYGAGITSNIGYCSRCEEDSQYVGETFSITAAYSITSLDFYAQTYFPGTGDLTIAFFDAPESLVHSQTFTLGKQTKTVVDNLMTNISVTFSPFQLSAGSYAVFFFGQDLSINTFYDFGLTQIRVVPSIGIPYSAPEPTIGSSAIRLSGTPSAVPEPENLPMLMAGIGLICIAVRRKR